MFPVVSRLPVLPQVTEWKMGLRVVEHNGTHTVIWTPDFRTLLEHLSQFAPYVVATPMMVNDCLCIRRL